MSRINHDTSFCTDVGQVRTGNDVEDTYFKMLQEITRVTAGVANGITGEYKSVRELMNACRHEGELVIANLEVGCFSLLLYWKCMLNYSKDNGNQNWYVKRETNWPGNLQETPPIFHRAGPRFCRLVTMHNEWELEPQGATCTSERLPGFGICCWGNEMSSQRAVTGMKTEE